MGRRARDKANRRTGAASAGLTPELLGELFELDSVNDLEALLARRPELTGPGVEADLKTQRNAPGYGPTFGRLADLLHDAQSDIGGAWSRYTRARREVEGVGDRLEHIWRQIEAAADRHAHDEVIALADEGIPQALEAGFGLMACSFEGERARALLNRVSEDRADDLEEAIGGYNRALELALGGDEEANLVMQLGAAYTERLRGERADNLEVAVELHRVALHALGPASPPGMRALMKTNLAVVMLRSERGDRLVRLRAAAQLCRDALGFRSPDQDAIDWAYSQINLATALEQLAALEESDPTEAIRAFEQVIDQEQRVPDKPLVGLAYHGLGRLRLARANASPEQMLRAYEAGQLDGVFENEDEVRAACGELRRAVDLLRDGHDPLRYARALNDLSRSLAELRLDDEAIAIAKEALAILRPTTAPTACLDAASTLGSLLAQRAQWTEAADAYRDALRSAEILFHGRLDTAAREREARRTIRLYRWASFVLARAGAPLEAAIALESGRAPELRRRLGLPDLAVERLGDLSAALRDEYAAAVNGLMTSRLDTGGAAAGRRLQEVLAAIRSQPGLESFATTADARDLLDAVEPGWPVIYVNPTPFGTLLLRIDDEAGEPAGTARLLEQPTSSDVFMWLVAGDPDRDNEVAASYLFGISGEGQPTRDFSADLDEVLPWIGEHLSRHIRELATADGSVGVTLVPCGPVAAAPLHAAPWNHGGHERCLLDMMDVRYSPSAALCAASHRRSRSVATADPRLVAVADPTDDLPAARPEVMTIAKYFDDNRRAVAIGAKASRRFLTRHARKATHLHLACHARGALFNRADAALRLSDGTVSAEEITSIGPLSTRVVVVSACQGALSEISGLPEEAISLGTAFVAAGSACAVVSLWPVDDLATALLVTRFYEEAIVRGHRPPEALRHAQLWLRALDANQEAAFLSRHTALADRFRRREGATRRARRTIAPGSGEEQPPYAHPDYWAPFIAVGT
jgi:CHAT domain-containing protein/tetratricopeptide (TPR) repeat protein